MTDAHIIAAVDQPRSEGNSDQMWEELRGVVRQFDRPEVTVLNRAEQTVRVWDLGIAKARRDRDLEDPATVVKSICFVQNRDGHVKIGFSRWPGDHVVGLQVGNSKQLTLIRMLDGGEATKKWLHRRYTRLHIRGDWFRFSPDMMSVVPPDEIPVPQVERPRLRLTLKEELINLDKMKWPEGRLFALQLAAKFDDDDARDFIAWVRERTGVRK